MSASEYQARTARSYKLLLIVSMVSMVMIFAGLTSAFVVSKSREDWLKDFQLPTAFLWSTAIILLSSVTFHLAKNAISKDDRKGTTMFLGLTLALGLIFVYLQFVGFSQIMQMGYYLTGPSSTITTTFLFVLAVVHLAHLFGGIISLLVVIIKHLLGKYTAKDYLGIELGLMFWHFLDALWIYLFLFLYFFK
jgi:cytochrome c oxidase subunit 3